jgi:hypothetical protein
VAWLELLGSCEGYAELHAPLLESFTFRANFASKRTMCNMQHFGQTLVSEVKSSVLCSCPPEARDKHDQPSTS